MLRHGPILFYFFEKTMRWMTNMFEDTNIFNINGLKFYVQTKNELMTLENGLRELYVKLQEERNRLIITYNRFLSISTNSKTSWF